MNKNELYFTQYVGEFIERNLNNTKNFYNCVYILKCEDLYYVGASKNLNKRIYSHDHGFINSMDEFSRIYIFVYDYNLDPEHINKTETEAMNLILSKGLLLFNQQKFQIIDIILHTCGKIS